MIIMERILSNGATIRIDDAYMAGPEESARIDEQVQRIALEALQRRVRREMEAGRERAAVVKGLREEMEARLA